MLRHFLVRDVVLENGPEALRIRLVQADEGLDEAAEQQAALPRHRIELRFANQPSDLPWRPKAPVVRHRSIGSLEVSRGKLDGIGQRDLVEDSGGLIAHPQHEAAQAAF